MNANWFPYQKVVGWVMAVVGCAALTGSAWTKLSQADFVMKQLVEQHGYPKDSVFWIGVAELACVVLYLIPQTSLFGLAMVTGYLGGAVATHVHAGEAPIPQAIFGVWMWIAYVLIRPDVLRAGLGIGAEKAKQAT